LSSFIYILKYLRFVHVEKADLSSGLKLKQRRVTLNVFEKRRFG